MLKIVFLCRRRPELSRADYVRAVLERHVPLALAHHPTLRRYVVNVTESDPEGGPVYDSLPALYFDTLRDFQERLYDSPEGQAIVHRDVQTFMAGADAYATSETFHRSESAAVPLGTRSPGIKWLCPLRRRDDVTHQDFVARWRKEHVPLLLETLPLVRLVTNAVEARLSPTGEDWDGFAELVFPDEDAARAARDAERTLARDRERFAARHLVYEVGEYVQKEGRS